MSALKPRQTFLDEIRTKPESFWENLRQENALELFHKAAQLVPAYKHFLQQAKVDSKKIKTFNDFRFVPPVSKQNYLRQYPLKDLVWRGDLRKPLVFTSTTGSTGEPFYFPRSKGLDWQYSILAELFLQNGYREKQTGPTLLIVVFGMGVWIGGLITYKAFEIAGVEGNHPLSIITPGINKDQIFTALKNLSPNFAQTIIAGYPPFVKDIIDEAVERKINLKKLNLRLLFAAEAFSEHFRDHLVGLTGVKNLFLDTLNIYGTADIGAMAWETPAAIFFRRLITGKPELFARVFGSIQKTPTLAQYNPNFMTFEAPQGEILLTGDNTIPLVRYAIGDHGGVYSFSNLEELVRSSDIDLKAKIQKQKLKNDLYQLPFVYVYERSDFSVVLSGANIYPEEIREALQNRALVGRVTGKFTMTVDYDKNFNEQLTVHIELRRNQQPTKHLSGLTQKLIIETLLKKNSEFEAIFTGQVKGSKPLVKFWPYEHALHFKPGIKQKWVKK